MNTKDENPTAQILVVDDEVGHAEVMAEGLRRLGHVCTIVHDLPSAKDELSHGQFDLIVTDLSMDGEKDGLDVLAEARKTQNNAETIMVTAHGDVPTAKAAIKGGAFDFIEKPIDLDVLRTLCSNAINTVFLRDENTSLRQRIDEHYGFEGIIGHSPAIRNLIQTMRQVAPSNIPVLITGESGTGKELVAQALHNNSKRAKKQFVPLNCAGLSESILEDELFGHVRGAFTGADREREGRFEYANNGTLFLDEVGDMPLPMQAKLLRVLESGEVVRLGSNKVLHVDVRLISATNRDLTNKVKEGTFREDLYFRIKGVELHLPSLRERREDIPLLVSHYANQFAQQLEKPAPEIAEDLNMMLMQFDWPGNVRQLINVVQNMVIINTENRLDPQHLPQEIKQALGSDSSSDTTSSIINDSAGLRLDQIEKQAIRNALRINAGNREQAAKMLGIGERTLYRKLKEYGLK
ncbi:DNA-binding transcriptional response regulator [Poriferisphaera corsica]|uniref:DNA-binding transcriptional response regulator n=1 Tax=Poriferisphaera corsica TaxID=2528020 RepID=A0A517YTY8_9BACT|nr:sigma-54 dependent transcriptional regulator [Poriferisphaera corsica]QDU33677.1 DNA-binding transcriptional response regulator [Poriferisphaera corsica]